MDDDQFIIYGLDHELNNDSDNGSNNGSNNESDNGSIYDTKIDHDSENNDNDNEYNNINNVGGAKYPSIKDDNFYQRIASIYKRYKIPKRNRTFKEICFPTSYQLQAPQQFMAKFLNPNTPYKGVLVYHRIGAGKTCTAIRIAEEWKHHRKIIVVLPASLKGNFRGELRSPCGGNHYLTQSERERLAHAHPLSIEYKEILTASDKRIDKYYSIYSYNKFIEKANRNELNLRNTILIIDEIQNMVSEDGSYYETIYELIHSAPKDLRIVLLSATPMFDKPNEIALTMNLLRIPKELPTGRDFYKTFVKMIKRPNGVYNYQFINVDLFKERIKGYVSFFRGAPAYVFPEMYVKYVKCEMSEFQYRAYQAVLRNEENQYTSLTSKKIALQSLNVKDLPNNFFIGTRVVSNIVFPNRKIGEEGFVSLTKNKILENLEMYSIKFHKIITKIKKSKGKVFVYSGFKEYGGIKSFIKVLEAYGYKNYAKHGEGLKRFAVWSGDENMKMKDEIKSIYNQKDNLYGKKLKILMLSPSAKEGLSLTAVRQVHILEPYWNQSRLDQIIGRASRYCSHKDLPEEERNVMVYVYIAIQNQQDYNDDENRKKTIDQYMQHLALQKNKLINEFERAIKESAIDCTLNYSANNEPDDENGPLICDK